MIEDILSIVVLTYNRAKLLEKTLDNLFSGPLRNVSVTILNNASTDNTLDVCAKYTALPNVRVVTHRYNIGGPANTMRAYEYADKEYLWVMSDDDDYDFSEFGPVAEALESGRYESVHIGAYPVKADKKYRGRSGNIQDLVADGYDFFRVVSNVACTISRTSGPRKAIVPGYENIVNHYPHIPFFIDQYYENKEILILKEPVLKVVYGYQSYSFYNCIKWWVSTSYLMHNAKDRRTFVRSQYTDARSKILAGCYLSFIRKGRPSLRTIYGLWSALPWKNRLGSFFIIPFRYFEIKKDIRKANASKKQG